ncbi:hypothetical protein [Azospirillum sp. sgz301742]
MSLRDDSDLDRHDGWLGAALVFAAGVMAALLLGSIDWRPMLGDGDAFAPRTANTRQMVILPLHLR